jgi:Domain of Unknown Function with PDB structure (DUF3857)
MRTLLCFLFLASATISYGQFKTPKFGKIEPAELSMAKYDKDTAAGALILFDDGDSYFVTNSSGDFQVIFERHCRIKIFKKSAFDLANLKIRLEKTATGKETISSFKAATFNVENGKMVQIKLEKENIFEETAKNYTRSIYAFPQVKEGSIIEFSYTITSDFFYNLRGWVFQGDYPSVWTQYETKIPEYFEYRPNFKGYLPFVANKEDRGNTSFTFYDTYSTPGGGIPRKEANTVMAYTVNHLYAVSDVPAFKSEPNIDCEDNYIQAIDFELSSVQYPGDVRKSFTETWESVNDRLNKHEMFGEVLKGGAGFVNDTVEMLCKGKKTELEKASAIYSYVQKRMKWNRNYNFFVSNGLRKPYKDHAGNTAEINFLLMLMFKNAGLNVSPVIFSTRDNGIVMSFFPTISKYNSVLAKLVIEDKTYLLDASSEFSPMGVLPANDINGKGRVVDKEKGDWVDLVTNALYIENKTCFLKLNADGTFNGTIETSYDGYAALSYRKALSKTKKNDEVIKLIQENEKGLNVNDIVITNRYDIDQPIRDSLNVTIKDNADVLGNKILFTPLLFDAMQKNIYKLEDRKYPVNYNYPVSETCVFEYTIPEGYLVESLPKPVKIKNPDNSISVQYIVQSSGDKISVLYRRNISKILFLPDEYQDLKEFYNLIVKTHSDKIILKKA